MTISYQEAVTLAARLLASAGLRANRAWTTARAIVLADVWGIGSHGLMRLPYYLDRMAAGGYPPDAELTTTHDTGPLASLDGGGGLGHWQLSTAAAIAAERCRRFGIAAVAVGNSGHCGALGVYTWPVLDAGFLAVVVSNGPAVMPPWGGREAVVSTSPVSIGVPARPSPIVADLAMSAVARGKVVAKVRAAQPIPEGWVVDRDGCTITDPALALGGMLAPMGGAKGFALALCVEALTGGVVGPALAGDVSDMFDPGQNHLPQRTSHLIIAIDPVQTNSTGSPGDVQRRLDDLAERVVRAGGRIPGEGRQRPDAVPPTTAVAIADDLLRELHDRAKVRTNTRWDNS